MRASWLLLAFAGCARAQDADEAALALADRTSAEPAAQRTCLEHLEAGVGDTSYSNGAASSAGGRNAFDIRCDGAFAREWRGVFSDRLDYFWGQGTSAQAVNTLKEAYLSFRYDAKGLFDLGRINV